MTRIHRVASSRHSVARPARLPSIVRTTIVRTAARQRTLVGRAHLQTLAQLHDPLLNDNCPMNPGAAKYYKAVGLLK
jgi:hypothetical protein